jgi:hypothetical protein
MNVQEFQVQIACYPTKPGDLVVVTVGSDRETARRVGEALSGSVELHLEILSDEQLAAIGLQRIPAPRVCVLDIGPHHHFGQACDRRATG